MNKEVKYKNVDVLLMDPAYSRWIPCDEDTELECVDFVVETFVDGLNYIFSGHFEEYHKDDEHFQKTHAIGVLGLDTGRIGVYDLSKVVEAQPELIESIEKKNFLLRIHSLTNQIFFPFVLKKNPKLKKLYQSQKTILK